MDVLDDVFNRLQLSLDDLQVLAAALEPIEPLLENTKPPLFNGTHTGRGVLDIDLDRAAVAYDLAFGIALKRVLIALLLIEQVQVRVEQAADLLELARGQ